MKTKYKLALITILLIPVQIMFAQEDNQLGRAPGFVKSEKPLPHYNEGNTLANTGYGIDLGSPVKFVSMPIPAGTPLTTINNNFGSFLIVGADIDNAGNYIGCTQVNQGYSELVLVNVNTGVPFYLASITGFSYYATSLAYNSSNSTWYFGSSNNSESRLYSLNILTGSETFIGQITGLAGLMSLAIDCDGNAYGIDIVTDQLFSINLSTGAGTPIGPLGFNANYGQDADFDAATNTLYLAAFNNGISQGEFRSVDLTTGNSTFITAWPGSQITGFAIDNICSNPCPVGAPSNPNPPNGANGVSVYNTTLAWSNGTGTTNVEVWFGAQGSITKVYDGPAITSWATDWLIYQMTYLWKIVSKNDTCATQGPTWSFTTEPEPFPGYWCDDFNSLSNWTIVGPLGTTNWSASNSSSAGGTAPELRMSWTPSFNGISKIRSGIFPLQNNNAVFYEFKFFFDWYANTSGTVTVGITYDGGVSSSIFYSLVDPTGNVGPTLISGQFYTPSSGSQNAQIEITFSGNSFNNDNIYWDELCLWPGFTVYPPNPPSNLTAQVILNPDPQVQLNWQDNSWNENGFKIFRKKNYPNDPGEFIVIDTILSNITQYIDTSVIKDSTYSYSVFAFNQWGQNGSDTVTITVSVPVGLEIIGNELPKEFALHQNYPNPFNPNTVISYQLPVTGNVSLKIYDILGNEVATLVNEEQQPGVYEVEFNVAQVSRPGITSGVYFYKLKVGSFIETKKMILLK